MSFIWSPTLLLG
ncbi:hypothetical protein CFP56_026333 [Quercus suber]|uniref:Uncharacterized protein n=1 Tax=Quercus suber TaxID=58331 RepID=A0AAW0K140_QUESU